MFGKILLFCALLTLNYYVLPPPTSAQSSFVSELEQDISTFFDQGASGYLLWQYSGNESGPLDNDRYSFFKDDPVCQILLQIKTKYPDKFLGVNIHSLAKYNDATISDHLSYLSSSCATSVVRIWGSPDRGSPERLKSVLDLASQHNIKIIIALADYSNSSGDILPGPIRSNPTSWYQSGYQTHYLPHVRSIVSTIGSHPALFAYELANEPHCSGQTACPPHYNQWAAAVSSAIKSINPSVQVSIGQMASQNTTFGDSPGHGSPSDYTQSNSASSLDLASAHYYNQTEKSNAILALQQALTLGKTFYIGEAPPIANSCFLESQVVSDVGISQALNSHPDQAQDPLNKHPDYYPPNQEFVTICENQEDVSQTLGDGTTATQTATAVQKAVEENKFTSELPKIFNSLFKPVTNPFAPKTQTDSAYTSYDSDHLSVAYRLVPYQQQNQLKDTRLQDVINGTIIDEQIAWGCPSGCFTLNCGQPSPACRPIYLSELASVRGVSGAPPISDRRSDTCYQKLYQYLNPTNSGSLNSKVITHNVNDDQSITKSQAQDRMLPNTAVFTQTDPLKFLFPYNQTPNTNICKTVPRSEVKSTTNPVKLSFFHAIYEIFTGLITPSRQVTIEEQHDPRLTQGLKDIDAFSSFFIPYQYLKQIKDKPESGRDDQVNLVSPGGVRLEEQEGIRQQMMLPYIWRQKSL